MSVMQNIKCKLNIHKAGRLQPAVGGRNVKRCVYCDKILEEDSVMGAFTWKGKLNLPRLRLPKGKVTDKWFKK